jgi:two-component system, OmpR family, response regulator
MSSVLAAIVCWFIVSIFNLCFLKSCDAMRILLIEDEKDLSDVIVRSLREETMSVDAVYDGESGWYRAVTADFDCVVLDLRLPGIPGEEVLRRIRREKKTPVLLLTACDDVSDRVNGLNLGADDYVTKPFDLRELAARIRALVRRSTNHPSPAVTILDLEINTASRTVSREGTDIPLTAREYKILELLIMRRGSLVSRSVIYDTVYGEDNDAWSNVVDVHVSNLRRKLGVKLIETRRGEGYIIRE